MMTKHTAWALVFTSCGAFWLLVIAAWYYYL